MKHPLPLIVTLLLAALAALPAAETRATGAGFKPKPELQKIKISDYSPSEEIRLNIGNLIAAGKVQPASRISTDVVKENCWLLRTPNGPPEMRWPAGMLNWRAGAPDLTLDLGLDGFYDIYAEVHAVDGGGAKGAKAKAEDPLPMAFTLELEDGSKREIVGAKGFPNHHFGMEVMACHAWNLTAKKIILRGMGKPVYLSGFRLVPTDKAFLATDPANTSQAPGSTPDFRIRKVTRWVATDHVDIVREEGKHFAFPGVALLKNGDLAVVYREGTIHNNETTGKVSLSRSSDGGRTWLPRVTALDRPHIDDRDPSIFQMSNGTVLLTSGDCLCTSSDNAQTWSQPEPTPVFGPHGAVEDEDGHIVYGALKRVVQDELTRVGSRPIRLEADAAYRSKDQGKSWEPAGIASYTAYMPGPMNYVWLDEPFMAVVPHKFWIFSARVDLDGFARIIRSPDRGKTWEPIIRTPVWGYPQHLLRLRDGRLLMSYSYRREPWGVRACLSSDNGKTWDIDNEIVIRMDGGTPDGQPTKVISKDLGYPVSVQLADGRIFTVYYFNTGGSNCFIAGTFWNLPKE